MSPLKNNLIKIDIWIAYSFIVFGIFFFILFLLQNFDVSKSILILFIILFSTIYILQKNKIIEDLNIAIKHSFKVINEIFFVISFIGIIWILSIYNYPYPIYYFLLISMTGISIIISIFFTYEKNLSNDLFILFKIIILGLTIRQGIFYEFPHIYGIDPIFHGRFAEKIIYSSHIPNTGEFYNYQFYPIYHLVVSITKTISSLSIRDALFISIGSIQVIITTLFIYLIGKIVVNQKIGLIASFIFCNLPYVISYGFSLIPNMFGIVIFVLLLYLYIDYKNIIFSPLVYFIFILVQISLILTHLYLPFLFLLILFGIYFVNKYYGKIFLSKNKMESIKNIFPSFTMIVLFALMFIGYTIFVSISGTFWNILTELIYEREFVNIINIVNNRNLISLIFNNVFYYLIIGFSIFGILAWLNIKRRNKKRVMIIVIFFVLYSLIIFGGVSSLIFLPYRIWIFVYIPISLLTAQGIIYLYRSIIKKAEKKYVLIPIILISLIFFFSIASSTTNPGDGLYPEEIGYRQALTQSELSGLTYLINRSDGNFETDYYYENYVKYNGYLIEYENMTSAANKKTILIRRYFLKNSALRELSDFPKTKKVKISRSDYEEIRDINSWNIIYDNGNAYVYNN